MQRLLFTNNRTRGKQPRQQVQGAAAVDVWARSYGMSVIRASEQIADFFPEIEEIFRSAASVLCILDQPGPLGTFREGFELIQEVAQDKLVRNLEAQAILRQRPDAHVVNATEFLSLLSPARFVRPASPKW